MQACVLALKRNLPMMINTAVLLFPLRPNAVHHFCNLLNNDALFHNT
jgi:hypothetical protein